MCVCLSQKLLGWTGGEKPSFCVGCPHFLGHFLTFSHHYRHPSSTSDPGMPVCVGRGEHRVGAGQNNLSSLAVWSGKTLCGCGWKSSAKLWVWEKASSWDVRITRPCQTNFGGQGKLEHDTSAHVIPLKPRVRDLLLSQTPYPMIHLVPVCCCCCYFSSSLDCLSCCLPVTLPLLCPSPCFILWCFLPSWSTDS